MGKKEISIMSTYTITYPGHMQFGDCEKGLRVTPFRGLQNFIISWPLPVARHQNAGFESNFFSVFFTKYLDVDYGRSSPLESLSSRVESSLQMILVRAQLGSFPAEPK